MSLDQPNKVSFIEVDADGAGQRLDNFLFRHLKNIPKAMIYRIIRKGEVRVNKGRVRQTTRLKEGDLVRIPPINRDPEKGALRNAEHFEFLLKSILFEDDALLVINKPSGFAVHAGSGVHTGVIEAMRVLRPELRYLELVHRLDRATSGCLVLAKKANALRTLGADFRENSLQNNRLDKRYLALVKGRWQFGQRRVTKPLDTEARRHGERHVRVSEQGSYASSIMTPLACSEIASLLEVKLLTGRTHQVRVHALSENHPLAGDERYGDQDFNKSLRGQGLRRLFLHAAVLGLYHPITNEKLEFNAPLPAELQAVLERLQLEPAA